MGCLDENTLLALVDGTLDGAARAAVDEHVATCTACLQLVAAAADDAPPAAGSTATPMPERSTLDGGARVGRYVVLAPLGAGGMGIVYKAWDPELDRRVALKLLHSGPSDQAELRARILREAQAMARLSHPNVVAVYDVGTWHDQVFIAMELVEGVTLNAWWQKEQRTWQETAQVFLAAGRGLAAAHAAGLVHRDFKPDNVLIGKDGRVLVTDFGLARAAGIPTATPEEIARMPTPMVLARLDPRRLSPLELPLTRAGALLGSPAYMAPEQIRGEPADARADVFSFCVSLYEALYRKRPFLGESLPQLLEAISAGVPRPPPGSTVPGFLRRLLVRGLAAHPEDRHRSMAPLLAELERGPGALSSKRRAGLLALLLLLLATLGTLLWARREESRRCPDGRDRLAGVWDAEKRAQLQRTFRASGAPFAEEALQAVEAALDGWSERWGATVLDACLATRARQEQSPTLMDLRQQCLTRKLQDAQAMVGLFVTADARLVRRAAGAALSLPSLASCNNAQLLLSQEQPAPEQRVRVAEVERQLSDANALLVAGLYEAAGRTLVPALASARAARALGLESECLLQQGKVEEHLGHYDKAAAQLREAAVLGASSRRTDVAGYALCQLVYIIGNDLGRPEEALRWGELAEQVIEHDGNQPLQMGACEQHLGSVLGEHGRTTEALEHLRRALVLGEQAWGKDAVILGARIEALAVGLVFAGRLDEAEPLFRRAEGMMESSIGKTHPQLGESLSNHGYTLLHLGRTGEAASLLQRAVDVLDKSLGPDHETTIDARSNLAAALRESGDPAEALQAAQRAIDSCARTGACHTRAFDADALHEKGAALLALGRAAEAIAPLTEGLAGREKRAMLSNVAESRFALGQALFVSGKDRTRGLVLVQTARREVPASDTRLLATIDAWLLGAQ